MSIDSTVIPVIPSSADPSFDLTSSPMPQPSRLFIIDDAIDTLSSLLISLNRQGYAVECFTDGVTALAQLEFLKPDLILLDIDMPRMDGYQVCECLKKKKETTDIPVICMSGLGDTIDKVKAFKLGVVDYIVKPFGTLELMARIENQLEIYRLKQDLIHQNQRLQQEVQERISLEQKLAANLAQQQAINRLIEELRQRLDLNHIFTTTTQGLHQLLECDRVLLYQFDDDWNGKVVAESVNQEWRSLLHSRSVLSQNLSVEQTFLSAENRTECYVYTWHSDADKIRDTHSATTIQSTQHYPWKRGLRYVCTEDIYQCNFPPCYLEILEILQARSYLIIPVFLGNRLWGLLGSYQNSKTRVWQDSEIHLASHIASQVGVALYQSYLLNKTQEQSIDLKSAKEAAESANRAKGQFIAGMSHELRTPLNSILGFSSILLSEKNLTQAQVESLTIIHRSGQYLLDLINDVLDISKLEVGYMNINEVECDIYRLMENLVAMVSHRIQAKNLELLICTDPNLPQYVITDEQKLRQILTNLLSNAIKFTLEGRIILGAKVEEKVGSYNLLFTIQDTGVGISPEELNLLFKPFQQTWSGRKAMEGTGLGLAISYQLIQLLEGRIEVESTVGQGSTFSITLPIRAVPIHRDEIPISSNSIPIPSSKPDCKISCLSDVNMAALKRLLRQSNKIQCIIQLAKECNQTKLLQLLEDWITEDRLLSEAIDPENNGLKTLYNLVYNFQFETIVQTFSTP